MENAGKLILIVAAVLMIVGGVVWLAGKLSFRGMPGDIAYEGQGFRFYFPIVTCLAVSAALTLAIWVWRSLSGGR